MSHSILLLSSEHCSGKCIPKKILKKLAIKNTIIKGIIRNHRENNEIAQLLPNIKYILHIWHCTIEYLS